MYRGAVDGIAFRIAAAGSGVASAVGQALGRLTMNGRGEVRGQRSEKGEEGIAWEAWVFGLCGSLRQAQGRLYDPPRTSGRLTTNGVFDRLRAGGSVWRPGRKRALREAPLRVGRGAWVWVAASIGRLESC